MTYLRVASEVFYLLILWWRKSFDVLRKGTKKTDIDIGDLLFLYINLDHRVDRRDAMEKQFTQLKISNYERLSATKNEIGALGCSFSHLDALKKATDRRGLVVICEDDAEFVISRHDLFDLIQKFYNDSRLDVLCLGYNAFNKLKINSEFYITSNTQTAVCYISKTHVLEDLVRNAKSSINGLSTGGSQQIYAIDQSWKRLQKQYIFAVPIKRAVIQRASYSDIEQKDVLYGV